jgi:hypothetical protein
VPDSSIGLVAADGTTKQVDTVTMPNGDHREVVALGDPGSITTAAVQTTEPASNAPGLVVRQASPAPPGFGAAVSRTALNPSTVSQLALAFRTERRGASFCNASNGTVYLSFAGTSATGTADILIPPGGLYELPNTSNLRVTQDVSVVWAGAASDTLRIVEWF